MVRNIVLAVATLAVLVLVFVGYGLLVGTPAPGRTERQGTEPVPRHEPPTTAPLKVGDMLTIPAGGKIMFRRYDDKTGRPRDMFLCRDWQPVPGSKNEIRVAQPELAIRLPSGMIATISAEEGQITVDRLEESQMRPKLGRLAGDVRMVVDRDTGLDRSSKEARPEDLITIAVPELTFDLEIGELKTDDHIAVVADDFEIAGVGLHLIWNQVANRIETLTIEHGEQFVLYGGAGLLGLQSGRDDGAVSTSEPATAPVEKNKRRPPKHPPRSTTAYDCLLTGGLVAEQYHGSERVGGLDANEVHLLFDVGGANRLGKTKTPTTTAPASRPAREERNRLVVHWTGQLQLGPTEPPGADEPHRRRFEAVGNPVVLTRGDGSVRCSKVVYHDDTRRVWLYPTEGGPVEFGIGANLSASAESVFIDRNARIAKLIGNVELRSRRGGTATARVSSIRSSYWAELHLAESAATGEAADGGALVDVGRLESATFVGDVQVDLNEQQLTAHQLNVSFKADAAGRSFEESLDGATASGNVVLTSGKGRLEGGELDLAFALSPEHGLYPRRMDARGDVVIHRDRATVRGDHISADLEPPPAESGGKQAAFVMRTLNVSGDAELIDPENKTAARGQEIAAQFEGLNRLTTATVRGDATQPGLVHARPYTVSGNKVELDRAAQTIHVDGSSRLTLRTQRSLQGARHGQPAPVVVTSEHLLHIDGRRNTVRFEGDVVARSEGEELHSDNLALLLEDVADTAAPETRPAWQEAWHQMRRALGGEDKPRSSDDLFALQAEDEREKLRKEPVRLTADNALVTSETFEAGDDQPVVHASISAPLLEVDIVSREIVTTGLTDLLMTDRRGGQDVDAAHEALGLPTALLSRGPSQSAIRCTGRMSYTLGADGPERRDTVVFENQVVFVHRTGKEMVNLAEMLPQVTQKPELLDALKSRNAALDCDRLECWFAVDQNDHTPRRGGALTRAPLRLASMLASGSVYLRDQQDPLIREVNAGWLEFSREQSRIHVRGTQGADARVYSQDKKTGLFDVHAGPQLVINLADGTIRSDRIEGEMRRK
jgi:lipopolysaccharide export system protein LptA